MSYGDTMSWDLEKIIPGTDPAILPLGTIAYVDLPSTVAFQKLTFDFPGSVDFTSTTTGGGGGGTTTATLTTDGYVSGQALSVVVGSQATICSVVCNTSGGYLGSIDVNGDTDAKYIVQINSKTVFSFSTNMSVPNVAREFVRPISLNVGDMVSLAVVNGGSETANFTGALTGKFA